MSVALVSMEKHVINSATNRRSALFSASLTPSTTEYAHADSTAGFSVQNSPRFGCERVDCQLELWVHIGRVTWHTEHVCSRHTRHEYASAQYSIGTVYKTKRALYGGSPYCGKR
jgi:hypothetical protein